MFQGRRRHVSAAPTGFLKDLLTSLLGSASWVCDMGASSEGLKLHSMEKAALGI